MVDGSCFATPAPPRGADHRMARRGGTRRDVAKHAIEIYESADVGKVRPVMGIRAG